MKTRTTFLSLLVVLSICSCTPDNGGQSGSELLCQTTQGCIDNLDDHYACSLEATCEPAIDICPDPANPECPSTLTCDSATYEPNEYRVVSSSCTGTKPAQADTPWPFACECLTDDGSVFNCTTYTLDNPCSQDLSCCFNSVDPGN